MCPVVAEFVCDVDEAADGSPVACDWVAVKTEVVHLLGETSVVDSDGPVEPWSAA